MPKKIKKPVVSAVKVKDLKPKKDAKGGGGVIGAGSSGGIRQS